MHRVLSVAPIGIACLLVVLGCTPPRSTPDLFTATPDSAATLDTLLTPIPPTAPSAFTPTCCTGTLTITPSLGVDGGWTVLPGGEMVIVMWPEALTNAVRVDFSESPGGTGNPPQVFATDTDLSDGASISWQVPQQMNKGYIQAAAYRADGSEVDSNGIGWYTNGLPQASGITPTGTLDRSILPTLPPCVTPTPLPPGYEGTPTVPCVTPDTSNTFYYSEVRRFESDQQAILPGTSVTLHWETTAKVVIICERHHVYDYGTCIENLPPSGTYTLTTDGTIAPATIIDLAAVPPTRNSPPVNESYYDARIIMPQVCPHQWFFLNPPPDACPITQKNVTAGLAQPFENALMIENLATKQVFMLMNDGTVSGSMDSWTPDMPDSDPALVPPNELYQPVRNLGWVWRAGTDLRHFPAPREYLGWATAPESAVMTDYQCDWSGADPLRGVGEEVVSNCWLLAPNGQTIVLWSDPFQNKYGWEVWSGP